MNLVCWEEFDNKEKSMFNTEQGTTRAVLACLKHWSDVVLSKSAPSLPRLKAGPGLETDY